MQQYFAKNKELELEQSDYHHIKNVMRMKAGDIIKVAFDNVIYTCEIISLKDDVVLLSTGELATVINVYNRGLVVKTFGTNECIRIDNKEKNSVHIKRKIKTR